MDTLMLQIPMPVQDLLILQRMKIGGYTAVADYPTSHRFTKQTVSMENGHFEVVDPPCI